jgi:hypothetical protein
MFPPLFPRIEVLPAFLIAAFFPVALGGAISSSGLEQAITYTCHTLPERASQGLTLRIERDIDMVRHRIVLVENRGVPLAAGLFPAIVERTHPANTRASPGLRFVDSSTGIRVDVLVDEHADFWTSTHLGSLSFDAPSTPKGFQAFVACRAAMQQF